MRFGFAMLIAFRPLAGLNGGGVAIQGVQKN
jgi:hypothetical protein